jgi:hypothetical protein
VREHTSPAIHELPHRKDGLTIDTLLWTMNGNANSGQFSMGTVNTSAAAAFRQS